jgi:hypothetical protein
MQPLRQPIPGVLPPFEPGQRVRVVSGRINLGDGESVPTTALAFVAAMPVSEGGKWLVPVVGHGKRPVEDVEKVG